MSTARDFCQKGKNTDRTSTCTLFNFRQVISNIFVVIVQESECRYKHPVFLLLSQHLLKNLISLLKPETTVYLFMQ